MRHKPHTDTRRKKRVRSRVDDKSTLSLSRNRVRIINVPNILTSGLRLEDLEDELCRRDLHFMVQRVVRTVSPAIPFKDNWHIQLVCEYLQALESGQISRLAINIPPRSLKSIICSVAFPARLLGNNPSERIICASYVDRVATELSLDCRTVIRSDWYKRIYPNTVLADDQDQKTQYRTTMQGFRRASSVGSSITGSGGRYKLLDDPIDPQRGFSTAEREKTIRWLDHTWSSREDDPINTKELLIMQRIHVHDPTSHLVSRGGWELLKIPQEAPCKVHIKFPISGQEIIRKKGDLIHPDRFGKDENERAKKALGTYGYSAQQMQEPIPLGGHRIKMEWFPRYKQKYEQYDEIVMSLDTASSTKQLANPSAMLVFGRKGKQWDMLTSRKERVAYPDLKKLVISAAKHYKPDNILIENKSSGQSLIQDLLEEKNFPYPITKMEPESEKPMRMEVQLPQLEQQTVRLPEEGIPGADWMYSFTVNLSSFPSPEEWDEIDAFSQFLKWIKNRGGEFTTEGLGDFADVGTKTSDWRF